MLEGQTSGCCKNLRRFLAGSERLIKLVIAGFFAKNI